ncbi:MAG: M48 family metallopeptidase [Planctomycetaceae bacterium]|jgi:Zn-dependent protease with chaperone function|nr:M48 family metallopeptidase [Planctomycetaceae bacterium]
MDFFQHQEQAKKRTILLVFLYGLAVVLLVAAVYILVAFCIVPNGGNPFDPVILFGTVGGVLLLVLGGSCYKISELSSGGGRAIAESLGGRAISPSTYQPAERRLYNVVEEMALAAGVPVPTVYIMDNEPGINAFAAGFSPREAVIGVNRGTVDLLTRDELQGVIAHEFSHILNGDMRMNLRLIGILFGLQILTVVGYYAMRLGSVSGNNRNRKSGGSGTIIIVLIGLGVMILGYVGMFFSAIIKAAISRQREFLADASAVQFTRNPDGIAGALKKIGCPNIGSAVSNKHAAEASHLFFGNVCSMFSFGNMFATHPDLTTRIRRIDPHFDGRFPKQIEPVHIMDEIKPQERKYNGTEFSDKQERLNNLSNDLSNNLLDNLLNNSIENIGNINPEKILIAGLLLQSIPDDIADAAREPLTAKATFYAILLDADETIRQQQFGILSVSETPFIVRQTQQIFQHLQELADNTKIPLAQRIMVSLRQLTLTQYNYFSEIVNKLIAADQKMSLLEYTLKAILLRDLDVHFGIAKPISVRYSTLDSVRQPVIAVLSFLAYSGHTDKNETQKAFEAAKQELGFTDLMLCDTDCTVLRFDQSLRILAETLPTLKKRIFTALMICIRYDGKITVKEGELIRAIAAMLAIPMPDWNEAG